MKIRLDRLLVGRALTSSRERAQALILAGKVLVNEQKVEKSGASVDSDAAIRLLGEDLRYVSRGGVKLERALEYWHVDLRDKTCLDIGASTGGFTDCMLQHGATSVIAIDTGYGQIEFRLRNDARVHLLEKTNARYLESSTLAERSPDRPISFIAIDVSFISATLVLPAVIHAVLGSHKATEIRREIVVLVKPQFEAGREAVGKGGIVRSEADQQAALSRVKESLIALHCADLDAIDSPILGAEGNREFLLHALLPASL
jgi:23S rRNA (cytidine1920-2'-O)/16S rRNA (cytidine1409-2'-O)-methyltransferase